jgi:hypothetical protein
LIQYGDYFCAIDRRIEQVAPGSVVMAIAENPHVADQVLLVQKQEVL